MASGFASERIGAKLQRISGAYEREVRKLGHEPRFLAAAAFWLTFLAARVVTHFLLAEHGGGGLVIGSLHIHHMIYGLVLVLVSGILGLLAAADRTRAVLFGIGAALVLDEFALILNLADVYWTPQGRESVDAVIIFAATLMVVALGGGFWRAVWHELVRGERAAVRRI